MKWFNLNADLEKQRSSGQFHFSNTSNSNGYKKTELYINTTAGVKLAMSDTHRFWHGENTAPPPSFSSPSKIMYKWWHFA